MCFLADISGSELVAYIFGVGGLVVGIIGLLKKQETVISNQPLSVELIEQFVTKDEFAKLVSQVNKEIHQLREIFRVEIPQMERRIAEAGEHRVTKLHDRINEVLTEVSTLEGEIKQLVRNTR